VTITAAEDADAAARPDRASWPVTLLVVVAYSTLTAWWLWPLPLRLADHLIYPVTRTPLIVADLYLILWALAWDTHALLHHPLSLFDANILHPAKSSLAFSEHFLGYLPLFGPPFLATGNAVLAGNVVIMASFPLGALSAYALARRFVAPAPAFVAGALFVFHGERYVNLYHLHQLGTFGLPLALLFTERWLERARLRDAVALGVAVALQLLTSFYLGYALVLAYGAYLPIGLWRWRRTLDRRRIVGLAVTLVTAGMPALLASLPYLRQQRLGLVPSGKSPMVALVLEPFVTYGRVHRYLTVLGVGRVGYALGALALVTGWRRGGAHARVLALVLCATGVLLALGPEILVRGGTLWSPYALLFDFLPGFRAVRLPFRFLVIAQLGFALLAALGVAVLVRWLPRALAWPVAAAAVALVLATSGPRPPHALHRQPTPATLPPAYRWLARRAKSGALLELPAKGPEVAGRRMLLSTHHWLPLIEGYSAYPPLTNAYLARIANNLPDPVALQELVDAVDVRWLLVHLLDVAEPQRTAWRERDLPGLRRVAGFANDLLFEVTLPVANDRRALLHRTDQTLDGLAMRAVGERCPGRIDGSVIADDGETSRGEVVRIQLHIVNDGPDPLPGNGLYPRHLVKMRAQFRNARGQKLGIPIALPIWVDVPAAGSADPEIRMRAPSAPGDWQLDLELEQDGDSLARCGMASTSVPLTVVDGKPGAASPEEE
jgi:hypothetical protein